MVLLRDKGAALPFETIEEYGLYKPTDFGVPAKIAAFDFDGTIISVQSGAELLRYLIGKRMIEPLAALKIAWWGARYQLKLPVRQSEVREDIFKLFKDDSPQELCILMRDLYESRLKQRYFCQALETIERLKQEGYYTLIISASFDYTVAPAAEEVGVHGLLATRMELNSTATGFTGKVLGKSIEGQAKLEILNEFCDKKFGPGAWILEYAFGDHYSDAPLLETAAHPHPVCPDRSLRKFARKRGWQCFEWDERA